MDEWKQLRLDVAEVIKLNGDLLGKKKTPSKKDLSRLINSLNYAAESVQLIRDHYYK
jgi:hypothetical protein